MLTQERIDAYLQGRQENGRTEFVWNDIVDFIRPQELHRLEVVGIKSLDTLEKMSEQDLRDISGFGGTAAKNAADFMLIAGRPLKNESREPIRAVGRGRRGSSAPD